MPQSFNEWDSLSFAEVQSGTRLFGNRNIGDLTRTSLQVSGMLVPGDATSIVTHWYARINTSTEGSGPWRDQQELNAHVNRFCNAAVVVWMLNDRYVWRVPLADLLWHRTGLDRATPRLYWPELVHPRSFIGADIIRSWTDVFTADQRFLTESRVWVHLCGLRLRPEEDGDIMDAVMTSLTKAEGERTSVEKRVVDWVMGLAKEVEKPEDAAQLHAVADGILEGRHR